MSGPMGACQKGRIAGRMSEMADAEFGDKGMVLILRWEKQWWFGTWRGFVTPTREAHIGTPEGVARAWTNTRRHHATTRPKVRAGGSPHQDCSGPHAAEVPPPPADADRDESLHQEERQCAAWVHPRV